MNLYFSIDEEQAENGNGFQISNLRFDPPMKIDTNFCVGHNYVGDEELISFVKSQIPDLPYIELIIRE